LALFGQEKSSIKGQYVDNEGYTGDQKSRLVEITSDAIFTCPLQNSLSNYSLGRNIFTYYFETPYPGLKDHSSGNFCDGFACHGSDLAYLVEAPFQGKNKSKKLTSR
jgi:carboxylesterase type B